jgi:hypothetical protein
LKELLVGKTPDQILQLTVCEPALGSGAFLNEAINQLAEAYLEGKQNELKRRIPESNLEQERQRVKAFLADNRVFGVDQNPVAVELAEISLWLNTIYQGHTIPWFGGQLATGNSLIGARRQVFRCGQLTDKGRPWLEAVPERIPATDARPQDGVYHFLVPDKDMSNYGDKVVKAMCPNEMKRISDWRKTFRDQFDNAEAGTLVRLSEAVDRLWARHTEDLRNARMRTAHDFAVWGQPSRADRGQKLTTRERDAIFRKAIHPDQGPSTAYQRLRFVMDYWCALWFWPIEKAHLLPTRHAFLLEVGSVLEGTLRAAQTIRRTQGEMFAPEQPSLTVADEYGMVDVNDFCEGSERLTLVRDMALKHRFFHWELEFADIFADAGGFDLILGNPPWIRVEWNPGAVIGDVQPFYVLRGFSSPQLTLILQQPGTMSANAALRDLYLDECVEFEGTQSFFSARQNYPLLPKGSSNTFKCFVAKATDIARFSGYVHDDGMFNDPKGGDLRKHLYPRLRYWFQFENEIPLFEGLNDHGRMRFEVSILGPPRAVEFDVVADVFWPSTIDKSYGHDGTGVPEARKDKDNKWSLAGHRNRILHIDESSLRMFAELYDSHGTEPLEARLPPLRARELIEVLRKCSEYPTRLGMLAGAFKIVDIWNETNAVLDGTIRKQSTFPGDLTEAILSGPHINVANPRFKTPSADWKSRNDYDLLDLTDLPEDYVPRSNYIRACSRAEYEARIPSVSWGDRKPVTDYFRLLNREMAKPEWERMLQTAIVPPGVCHINVLLGTAFEETQHLLRFAAATASLPVDFRVKTTGMGHINRTLLEQLPLVEGAPALFVRVLLLNCLTAHYSDFWRACWDETFAQESWAKKDRRLRNERFSTLSPKWSRETPLRSDYERRQALVELDVLVGIDLGLTVEDLCSVYRLQFDLLNKYERNTYYDRNGRIVYLDGDQAFGLSTPDWKKKCGQATIERIVTDDTLPSGPWERTVIYEAPFDQCDREEDYRTAWAEFKRRRA